MPVPPVATSLNLERRQLKLLYLRLTDSAPLTVAQEMGFFARFGLEVQLQRETSWATLRDKLIGGAADAAAMLAPMPLTLAQTLPQCGEQLLTGLILSCNGNAITLSQALYRQLALPEAEHSADRIGAALCEFLRNQAGNRSSGDRRLAFATVYPFSSHTLQLRHWLQSAGIDADRELQLQVLPPEQMVESLRRGDIDGYCVGEPWNTLAVQQGLGVIATPCNRIMPAMPEKVLAVTRSWHNAHPAAHLALRAALLQACSWLADPAQRADTVPLLAGADYLDLPQQTIAASLSGQLHQPNGHIQTNGDWHLFAHTDSDYGCPSLAKAQALLAQCREFSPVSASAEQAFRPDLYRQTLDFLQRCR